MMAAEDSDQPIISMEAPIHEKNVGIHSSENPDHKIGWDTNDSDKVSDTSNDLLKSHQRFGHLSFVKLQIIAKKGIIPKQYVTCDIMVCQVCVYETMIKKAWRNKPL